MFLLSYNILWNLFTQDSCYKGLLILITSRIEEDYIKTTVLEATKDSISKREDPNLIRTIVEHLKEPESPVPLQSNLQDYNIPVQVVPLLPLTRDNVRDCTQKIFASNKAIAKQHEVNAIVDQLSFFSQKHPIYAKHGCKQVAARIRTKLQSKQELWYTRQ